MLEGNDLVPPLSQYEEIKGEKFTIDYFKIPNIFINERVTDEIIELQHNIERIEGFVERKIQQRGMEDTVDSYETIINEIIEAVGRVDNELKNKTINRVGYYIDYLNKADA